MNWEHRAHNVLDHKPEEPKSFWVARKEEQDWFVLDLGMPINFNAVELANTWTPPDYHGTTNEFKYAACRFQEKF